MKFLIMSISQHKVNMLSVQFCTENSLSYKHHRAIQNLKQPPVAAKTNFSLVLKQTPKRGGAHLREAPAASEATRSEMPT